MWGRRKKRNPEEGAHAWFYVNTCATGWFWTPGHIGAGWLYIYPGMLRFEGQVHTNRRVVLSSPQMPIPDYFTVVTFEDGKVSVSIPKHGTMVREALVACGFEIIDAPERRMFPYRHKQLWAQYGAQPPQPTPPPDPPTQSTARVEYGGW